MHAALRLAEWVTQRAERHGAMTHLKLQKLMFYCYGAAVAHSVSVELGTIRFEPWNHGPVNRVVWDRYKQYGSAPIPPALSAPMYSPIVEGVMADVVDVYGRMSAWALRCESHLERPWAEAFDARSRFISDRAIEEHFRAKFAEHAVKLPTLLGNHATAEVDSIPPARFKSLRQMADMLRSADA